MGLAEVATALDALDVELAKPAPDAATVSEALRQLQDHRRVRYPDLRPFNAVVHRAEDLRRTIRHCDTIRALWPEQTDPHKDRDAWRVPWQVKALMEGLFVDEHGEVRSHRQHSVNHCLAFNRPLYDHDQNPHSPLPHLPLDLEELRALVLPYLQSLEAQIDKDPLVHFPLCWEVKKNPAAPFDVIFADWIADIDARGLGLGNTAEALDRGFALASIAISGRQRVSRKGMDTEVLPQLHDPHPLIVACAGRFVGMVYDDLEDSFHGGEPEPLADILDHIAALPRNRPRAAGGFLNGYYGDSGDPFEALKKDPRLSGYDVDGWVLRVLKRTEPAPEGHLPGAQAFWFYVHESYCFDPDFVTRLIDAGHLFEALMCATEIQTAEAGMETVLQRLAECGDDFIAGAAKAFLARVYQGTQPSG